VGILPVATFGFANQPPNWEVQAQHLVQLSKEYRQRHPELALEKLEELIELARQQGDSLWVAEGLIQMGIVAYHQDDLGASNSFYYQALHVSKPLDDPGLTGRIHNNIAWNHEEANDFESAAQHYRLSLAALQHSTDSSMLAWVLNNLGIYQKDLQQYDSALYYLQSSFELYQLLGNDRFMGYNLNNIGVIYLELAQPDSSLGYLRRAIALNIALGDTLEIVNNIINIADAHTQLGEFTVAEDTLAAWFPIMEEYGNFRQKMIWLGEQIAVCEALGEYQKVAEKQAVLLALKDSVHEQHLFEVMQELEAEYGVKKQRAALEDSYRVISNQRDRFIVLISILLGLVVSLLLLVRMYRIRRKREQELKISHALISAQANQLQTQNEELAQKNSIIKEKNYELSVMSDSVKKANARLVDYNQELTQAVRERTLALQQSNEQLVATNQKLENSNQELDTFLYKSSHDFGRPVSSLAGIVNLAEEERTLDDHRTLWKHVKTTAIGMQQLVYKLQMVHEISQTQKEEVPLDGRALIGQAMDWVHINRPEAQWEIVDQSTHRPLWQRNALLIKTLLGCLLENSWDFRKQSSGLPPRVILGFEEKENQYVLHYHDNGIGIMEEIQQKVFTMFFRGSLASQGNGLGLFIVAKILNQLNGEYRLSSASGQGVSFVFQFPKEALMLPGAPTEEAMPMQQSS